MAKAKKKNIFRIVHGVKVDKKNQLPLSALRSLGKNDVRVVIAFNKNISDAVSDAISVFGDYAYIRMGGGIWIDLRKKEVNAVYKRQRDEFEKKLKRSNEKARQAGAYVRKIQSERKRNVK